MLATWVLLVWLSSGSHIEGITQSFYTRESCMSAMAIAQDTYKKSKKQYSMACVKFDRKTDDRPS
jgi:predicted secreted Zn-dependent protease